MRKGLVDTIATYNISAHSLSEYFQSIPVRKDDVRIAFELLGKKKKSNPKVVEIGCADGRDSTAIYEYTNDYIGFDPAESLVEIAKKKNSEGKYLIASAENFNYPKNVDIVFSFASLLHSTKEELETIFKKIHDSLAPGGVFYVSLKYAEEYKEYVKEDKHGRRLFYLYNPQIIKEIAGDRFEAVYQAGGRVTDTPWFELALKKV